MIMKINIVLVCTLFLLPAMGMAQDKFTIAGKLSGGVEKVVKLNYINSDGKNTTDSAVVKNGKFTFTGTTAYANRASLSIGRDYQQFYLEKGNYKVIGKDSISNAAITGGRTQADFIAYNAKMGLLLSQWRDLNNRALKVYKKDSVAFAAIQQEAKPLHAKLESTLDSFIFSHPDSYVTVDLVNDNKTSVIDPVTFDRYYSVLSPRVLGSFTGKKLTGKYEKAKQISVGKTFDFTQQDAAGNSFTLSSLRGKYVLVDFWASWCAPCRAENPNMLKAYQALKEKNFEIVGISLDESKASWMKAVEKDGMPWIQVSDLKGWKNEVAVRYGITAVPQNVLIDPKGTIIAKDLRGEELTEKLRAYIK